MLFHKEVDIGLMHIENFIKPLNLLDFIKVESFQVKE